MTPGWSRRSSPRLWSALSCAYDRIAGARLAAWVAQRVPPQGSSLLDVGCGPGRFALLVASRAPGLAVVGVDFASGMVARAERARREKQIANCRFLVADAASLPFSERSFDAVRSTASLKFWKDPVRGIDEIHRVLSPGGRALLIEADREAAWEPVRAFLQDLGFGNLAIGTGGRLLFRFIRSAGLSRDEAFSLARRSRFAGGRVEALPRSPFFSMVLEKALSSP